MDKTNHTEEEFERDVIWIGELTRECIVKEFLEKWRNRIIFDD